MRLKTVQPPTCLSLKKLLKLNCLDNVQYLAEYLIAAQLCLPKAVYTRDIRSVIITSVEVLNLQRSVWNN